ncbi:MAG: Autotransporter-associated beta strand repeat protein [Pedosphaera sp.]|nr:Autotransporter-associated beta strand repeat protein [Pedosphaera sp.]
MKKQLTHDLSASKAGRVCEFAQRSRMSILVKKMATALVVIGLAGSVSAANKFWAGLSATTNAPVSGTWDTASTVWNNGTGNTPNSTFATGDVAIFGGVDGAYGIKGSTLSASTVIFNNSGYTLTNDTAVTVTASAGGNSVNVASGKTANIGTNVTLSITGNGAFMNAGTTFGGQLIIANGGTITQPNAFAFSLDGASGSMLRVLTSGVASHTGAGSGVRIGASANTSATLSIEGGTFNNTGSATFAIGNGAGATGVVSVVSGTLNVPNTPILVGNSATAIATNNLNGGSEISRQVKTGNSGAVSVFNFNGGMLKGVNPGIASLTNAFMIGLTAANVRNNGGIIDYNGTPIIIGQALVHSTIAGDSATDGGLIVTNSLAGGSLTLSNANTYNGATIVRNGAKLITTTLSTGAGSYTVADGGTLEVQVAASGQSLANSGLTLGTSGNVTNNFTLGANASTTVPAVIVNGALNLNGTVNVTVAGSGLTGPNTYLLMSYGSISGSGSFVAGTLPAVAGYVVALTNDTAAKQLKLVYVAAPQAVKWAVGDGNWDITTPNWQLLAGSSATNYVEGSLSAFDDSATGSSPITVTLAANRSPGGITNNSTKNYVIAGSANILGNGTIVKNGSSTLTIDNSGPNSLSAVTISGGALQVGNNDANGDLGSATVSDNATLIFNRTDNITSANVISGVGSLVQNGSGALTLSAGNTHTGLSTVNNGSLIVGDSSALQNSTVSNNVVAGVSFASGITSATFGALAGTGDISLLNAASSIVTLTVGGNNASSAYSGSLTGSGNLLKAGTNILTLSGNSTLNNLQVTASGGTLAINGGNSTMGALQIVTDNGTVLVSGGNTTVTLDSRIAGANGIYNVSGGTLNLPKMVIGSAAAANTNNLMAVSGSAVVNQNQPGGSPAQALWVGGNNNGSGALLLKDNASWANSSSAAGIVVIGGNGGTGQGSLTIQDSATFNYPNVVQVGATAGGVGTVYLNGGNFSANGFSRGSGSGTINANGGRMTALAANANLFAGFTATSGTNAVNLVSGNLTFDNGGFAVGITNTLSGAGGLIAHGGGTLTLSGSNSYTGRTTVNAGTLALTGTGSINNSGSVSNNTSSTLDVSAANRQLSISGTLTMNDSTLVANLLNTNITVGTFGTAGSANTINISALPTISSLPTTVRVIKYTTAASGLVDGGNNLVTLGVVLPPTGNPQGYLTNNTVAKSIDLIVTNYLLAPAIQNQPANDNAYAGGKAHFTVQLVVTNLAGVHYNWRKAGVPLSDGGSITGSTNSTLLLSNITAADAANYDVVITNNFGSVTSSPAALIYLTPTNYEEAAVAAGPTALYMFQETGDPATNTAAYDYQGDLDGFYAVAAQNGFNGVTGPTPADGFPGFDVATVAAKFAGFTTNSHVAIPPLNLFTNTVSFAAWIKPGLPPANCGLIFSRGGGTIAGFNFTGSLDGSGNRTLGYTWNSEAGTFGWNSQIAPPPGVWSYVALVVSPTNATIYIFNVNGLLSASQNYTHVNQSFSASTWIGDDAFSGGNRQFDGSMYGAAIYAKALSQSQLENIYGAASGVSNFAPVIVSQPANVTRYEHQTATFNSTASGTQPLAYQWKYFDGASTYTDIVNSGRISGAQSSSLSISNLILADAGNLVLVVTNNFGSVISSVAVLTVNPVLGPPTNITTSAIQPSTDDWDTTTAWSLPGSATDLAGQYYGSTFTILSSGGIRTPNFGNPNSPTTATFPGDELRVEGAGTYDTSFTTSGGIRIKGGNPSTVNFKKLVMAGGQISSILNSGWPAILTGEVNVISNTVVSASDDTSPRSINIQSKLTGNGNLIWHGYINFTTLQTASPASLNISNANNTYTGTWDVLFGSLVGSAPNALGTNTITVEAQGALQTTYDIYNPNSTLTLNGGMYLTQNDTFKNVIINGTNLNGGTYSYATLAAAYPANFPATWTPLNGALTATTPGGSITVLASTIASYPTNITVSVSGNNLSLTWPATHLGWIAQSNSVNLADANFWFDIASSQSATNLNVTINPGATKVFYRLRHP